MAKKLLKDMTYQELMSEAADNSAAWHGADSATQEALHQRNQAIYSLADAKYGTSSGFDSGTGEWSHGGGITDPQYIYDNYERLYGKADSGSRGSGGYRNQSYSEWKQGGEYQALMDTYRRQADTAMQDVLGQLSARTGGLASSYASAAAAQQYNDIMARLESVARQMYEGDRAAAMDEYRLNRAAADTAYNRAMYERGYNDEKTLQQKQEEAAAEEAARARVLEYFTGMGGTSADADEAMRELIAESGYTDAELAAMEKNYATLMALQRKKSVGSSGGGGGTKVVEDKGVTADYDSLFEAAKQSGYPQSFIANNYKKYGFTSATGLYNEYQTWSESDGGTNEPLDFSTYNEAASYLTENSLPASGLMTEGEWNNRKRSYKQTGQGGASVSNYATYREYLNNFVLYMLESNG